MSAQIGALPVDGKRNISACLLFSLVFVASVSGSDEILNTKELSAVVRRIVAIENEGTLLKTELQKEKQTILKLTDDLAQLHVKLAEQANILSKTETELKTQGERLAECELKILQYENSRQKDQEKHDDLRNKSTHASVLRTQNRDKIEKGLKAAKQAKLEGTTKSVYCDADTDGGGWIVTLRRQDGSINFTRSWNDYKHGFGNVDGEFWIGNDVLHELTKSKPLQLRVDMGDFDGNTAYAMYDRFQIGSETEKYILSVSEYSGTADDSFGEADGKGGISNGMKFTTFDSINERSWDGYCIKSYPGGWWFNNCFNSHLTATYHHNGFIRGWHGILLYSWLRQYKSLKFVEMKIR